MQEESSVNYVSTCIDCESRKSESLINSKSYVTKLTLWRGSRRTLRLV